ncbi:MAG: helix-turn-helix transcriptional regulator [Bacteroidota bacterium]
MAIANKNLKYLRKLRGWTQEEFAQKLRIKRSLVGAYEKKEQSRVLMYSKWFAICLN